jgi:hypothetical protein
MSTVELFVNLVAVLVIAGLALVPFVNLAVGTIVGGVLGGTGGFFVGALVALLISLLEIALIKGPGSSQPDESPIRQPAKAINFAAWRRYRLDRNGARRPAAVSGRQRRAA